MPSSAPIQNDSTGLYPYNPSHALPIVFAVLVGASLFLHIYQNFRYRFWKVTFFMTWGGAVSTTGWILRALSSYHATNKDLYIAQTVFIYAGPPLYAAAEYNALGRLMRYLPMLAPMHPDRVVYFFIYLGAGVESLTAAGASLWGAALSENIESSYRRGAMLISIALVLQGAVECFFMSMTAMMHYRAARSKMLTNNVRKLCIMLYGASIFILLRCIFRAIQSFAEVDIFSNCDSLCRLVIEKEWYLYAFEAAPMVLYTWWVNMVHPGRLLPTNPKRYLDFDARTERIGPGWIDRRSKYETFLDPWDLGGIIKGQPHHDAFWLHPDRWATTANGSFAQNLATNVRKAPASARSPENFDNQSRPRGLVLETE